MIVPCVKVRLDTRTKQFLKKKASFSVAEGVINPSLGGRRAFCTHVIGNDSEATVMEALYVAE